jgi:ABC-type glycerol-3-phosphate transport system permease component
MRGLGKWLVSMAASLVFLSPLLWMLVASFRPSAAVFGVGPHPWFDSDGWTLVNYASAWRRAGLARALVVSTLQVATIASAGLLVNAPAAFAFARLRFRGKDWLFGAVVALVILPVEALAVPLLLTARSLGLTGSLLPVFGGLTLPFIAKAFNIYFLRQHFLLVPQDLEEAAAVDGAGVWHQFWSVSLPCVKPALVTVVLLDLVTHWSDFLWPLMLTTREETRTVQLGLASLFTRPPLDWGAILACAVLATLPVLGMFRVLQPRLRENDARVGIL